MTAATFLYFLPGCPAKDVTPEELARRGLADRLGDCCHADPLRSSLQVSDVTSGPDGHGALLVGLPADGSVPEGAVYDRESQEWVARGAYWIGWNRDCRPNPRGLRRKRTVAGYEHELPDGNVWECPIIRRALCHPMVPCALTGLNGSVRREPVPEYRAVWERSLEWANHEFASGMPLEMQFAACLDALGLNYRLGREEISFLGLLTDGPEGSVRMIVEAALDVPWIKEAMSGKSPQKKTAWEAILCELGISWLGREDSSPTTRPAMET